jgi:hypothetical protein
MVRTSSFEIWPSLFASTDEKVAFDFGATAPWAFTAPAASRASAALPMTMFIFMITSSIDRLSIVGT